jgi:hypothetical protein
MDEVRIWNKARTQAEIQADMNHPLTGSEMGLVGYWQFNENTGNTVTDLAGNDNNGTILGGSTFTSGVFSQGTFVFSQPNFTVKEGGIGVKEVTINRIDGLGGEASVTVNLSDGVGVSAADYDNTPIVVNFANGEMTKIVSIPVKTDTVNDAGETINLTLTNATVGATIGSQNTANVTIIEDTALSFDGVNDYVNIDNYNSLKVSKFLTIEAWVNPINKNAVSMIVNKEGEYAVWRWNTGEISLAFANSVPGWTTNIYTGYFMPENKWTHLAVSYENGLVKTYANGNLVGSIGVSGR